MGKKRFLSTVGKEVLKSVINVMPIFTMSCSFLPKGTCQEITMLSVPRSLTGIPQKRTNWVYSLTRVEDILEKGGRSWRLLDEWFEDSNKVMIRSINTLNPDLHDKWCCTFNKKMSVLFVFNLLPPEDSRTTLLDREARRRSWCLRIKCKLKHILKKCFTNVLPVSANLKRRGMQVDSVCNSYEEEDESIEHVFFNCITTRRTWRLAS
ncbi:RNA-directed DNA polymerase (reversetranscriptase)-related family protein [Striga asiatica]|uniref:RNA-directed DNA polymerase (Reversetranscriptase)-related family protein n=1 Tax=Striga asiatica TaxID=4170 RepID=A0A5A7P7B6_STRAF|nr:RNA-directed DNA polymerase (reversetranscriptase)-related family protein [Striga asiatica]